MMTASTFAMRRVVSALRRDTVYTMLRPTRIRVAFIRPFSVGVQEQIMRKTEKLYKSMNPLNERVTGPLDRNGGEQMTTLPFVFLLGNHSSGKSSFINYVLQRNVQMAGVAPTDDGFTIIAPGDEDTDQDGPALIGDPDLGFSGLRAYGPGLIHHLQLKVRRSAVDSFVLVDSPGMIDAPNQLPGVGVTMEEASRARRMDRGYDFPSAVRWFAERADVILLFFDPDKPGTTGETLSVLTQSLNGVDHKLHIILNKVDQFTKIHDFARAYGSLCWNLSKVIHRKDLPRIYTMYIPQPAVGAQGGSSSSSGGGGGGEGGGGASASPLGPALRDLERTRADVVAEVAQAPRRRVDNIVTRLYDSARALHMHATVMESVRIEYRRKLWSRNLSVAAAGSAGVAASVGALAAGAPWQAVVATAAVGTLGASLLAVDGSRALRALHQEVDEGSALQRHFSTTHAAQLAEGDEFVAAVWRGVHEPLRAACRSIGLRNLPRVKASELAALDRIVDVEVPELRRMAAPLRRQQAQQDDDAAKSAAAGDAERGPTATEKSAPGYIKGESLL